MLHSVILILPTGRGEISMKLMIKTDDVIALRDKYGKEGAVAGYVEEAKLFPIPMPKFYVIIADDENVTLVQLDIKQQEKDATVIPISSIRELKVSGAMIKKIVIDTGAETYKLLAKPGSLGRSGFQKQIVSRLSEIK